MTDEDRLGASLVEQIEALLATLRSGDAVMLSEAAKTLVSIGSPATSLAISPLTEALKSNDATIRSAAAYALGMVGSPDAVSAIPSLIETLKDSDYAVRFEAASALGNMRRAALPAVDGLTAALTDKDEQVCVAASVALEWIRLAASTD